MSDIAAIVQGGLITLVAGVEYFGLAVIAPATSRLSEEVLLESMGSIHAAARHSMPRVIEAGGIVGVVTVVWAAVDGQVVRAILAGCSLVSLGAFHLLLVKLVLPGNRAMAIAAATGRPLPEVRQIQGRWNHFMPLRVSVIGLSAALALAAAVV